MFLCKGNILYIVAKWLVAQYYHKWMVYIIPKWWPICYFQQWMNNPKTIVNHPNFCYKWVGFQPSKYGWFILALLTFIPSYWALFWAPSQKQIPYETRVPWSWFCFILYKGRDCSKSCGTCITCIWIVKTIWFSAFYSVFS